MDQRDAMEKAFNVRLSAEINSNLQIQAVIIHQQSVIEGLQQEIRALRAKYEPSAEVAGEKELDTGAAAKGGLTPEK